MDENEAAEGGGGGFGDGVGAPMEQFHRNEAISAVADDGFLVEEEDDDYEDLYNDVNVGENFLQSFRKNEEEEKGVELVCPMQESGGASVPAEVGEVKVEKEENVVSRGSGRVEGFRDLAVRGNEMAARSGISAAGGVKIESCDPSGKIADLEPNASNNVVNREVIQRPTTAGVGVLGNAGNDGNSGNDNMVRQGMVNGNPTGNSIGSFGVLGGGGGGGGTVLFVGDLHWWTTDAELELELSKYGAVKEVKFFDEKASGKSKGYCQAEFHEPAATTACKEGMNGHVFNGRACVVAFATPYTVKRMGEAQVNRNQQNAQSQTAPVNAQARQVPGDILGKPGGNNNNATVGNFQGGGDNNRGFGRGNWGRGGPQGMGNMGPVGPMRNRPSGVVGRGFMGNGGGGFGQGICAASPLIHPQTMMGQGFDPAFGGPMGRMGGYGGFPGGPAPPFSPMLPSFPPVGGVGLPGVAPHVNPAFFGRGMPGMNCIGMMPRAGMEGPNMGMWSDPNMGGWGGDEHGYRAGESNYAAEPVSDHQYGEETLDRGAWPINKEKDRGSERGRSGSSDKRYRDDREPSYDRDIARDKNTGRDRDWQERRRQDVRDVGRERERDRDSHRPHSRDRDHDLERKQNSERERGRHRDDGDRYADRHRYRDREQEYDDEWDRGRSSRTQTKSRLSHEDDHGQDQRVQIMKRGVV